MAQTSSEQRSELMDEIAAATEEVGTALACLGEAFELVDVITQDKLEEQLFGPLQAAFARSQRMYTGFAQRTATEVRALVPQDAAGTPSQGAHGYIEQASTAVGRADLKLAELQDSMLPVEVGDEALRSDISAVRDTLGGLAEASRELRRRLGR